MRTCRIARPEILKFYDCTAQVTSPLRQTYRVPKSEGRYLESVNWPPRWILARVRDVLARTTYPLPMTQLGEAGVAA